MPVSLRLSDEAEQALEEWVESGRFDSKSEAIREALTLFDRVQQAGQEGETVLAFSDEDVEELREKGVLVGRELT